MPQGLEIYNELGELVVTLSTRLTRVIAVISPGLTDGSQSFPTAGNTLAAVLADFSEAQIGSGGVGCYPTISVSGNTVSWAFTDPMMFRMYTRILVLGY